MRRWLRAGMLTILCVYLAALADVVVMSRRDQRRPADAIVVLGAAQYNGRPSPVLKARLDHAYDLYRAGLAPVMIVTGGVATGARTSEATAAQRYLLAAGMPRDSMVLEAGTTTAASMDLVAAFLHTRGVQRVLLVSDPFHVARLHLEAWRVGLTASTSPTRTSPISRSPGTEFGYFLAEAAKLPLSFVRGLIS